jgi:hypothetical protein
MVRPEESATIDPLFGLLVGVIRRAKKDLELSSTGTNALRPSEYEKATAAEFLAELYASAARRSDP